MKKLIGILLLGFSTAFAQTTGGGPSGGGTGAVTSAFGRTSAVTANNGDYSVGQVTGAATSGANSNITSLTGLTTPSRWRKGVPEDKLLPVR